MKVKDTEFRNSNQKDQFGQASQTNQPHRKRFFIGDPVPWFTCRSTNNERFNFSTTAGRYIVISFIGSASAGKISDVVKFITIDLEELFDDRKISFFGVSIDPEDEQQERLKQQLPGIRYFWDYECNVSKLFGALSADQADISKEKLIDDFRPFTLVLDPALRVIGNISMQNVDEHNEILRKCIESLPPVDSHAGVSLSAPILIVPRIFEASFCKSLIEIYETHGGEDSGFMNDDGKGNTVGTYNYSFKRRSDYTITDQNICKAITSRIGRRLVPEIKKAFQYDATQIERFIIARYEGEGAGFFRGHRDNTTRATSHRKFAVTINLNSHEYEGGNLRFPEFGSREYRAPTGGAVVFSCSMFHEATPVIKGTRYAVLPFLYDAEAAKIREETSQYIAPPPKESGQGL